MKFIFLLFFALPAYSAQTAIVSWYGEAYRGKPMAYRKIKFDPDRISVAHRTLPFGTVVEFVNPQNNHRVVAVVLDRGPYIAGREFDLSRAAFACLAPTASKPIRVEYRIIK